MRPVCPSRRTAGMVLALTLQLACEDGGGPSQATAASSVSDSGTMGDSAASDAKPDASSADAAPVLPIGTGGTYAERCEKLAKAACVQMAKCCKAVSSDCVADLKAECLDPGKLAPIAEAAVAGKLTLNAGLAKKVDDELALLEATCSRATFESAFVVNIFAWVDPAGVGQGCATAAEQPLCAGGQGRCIAKTGVDLPVPLPTCSTTVSGEAECGKEVPCGFGATCSSLTGPKKCLEFGKFCGSFGDVAFPCPGGMRCEASACVEDTGAAVGQSCKADADCRLEHTCLAGKCRPKLCNSFQD